MDESLLKIEIKKTRKHFFFRHPAEYFFTGEYVIFMVERVTFYKKFSNKIKIILLS